jgi:hypothetical protein
MSEVYGYVCRVTSEKAILSILALMRKRQLFGDGMVFLTLLYVNSHSSRGQHFIARYFDSVKEFNTFWGW